MNRTQCRLLAILGVVTVWNSLQHHPVNWIILLVGCTLTALGWFLAADWPYNDEYAGRDDE